MRPIGTPQQLEKRRQLAVRLLKSGKSPAAVARAVSASRSSVQRWQEAYEQEGDAGLKAKPIPGRPARLTAKQQARFVEILEQGSLKAGYTTDLWTLDRIAQVLQKRFAVTYHPSHVWRLLHSLGWSCQKPEGRPVQRDDAAIAQWKRYRWPWIKKG